MDRRKNLKKLLPGFKVIKTWRNLPLILFSLVWTCGTSIAGDYVALEEHLGTYLPPELEFTKEDSSLTLLTDMISMPTIIAPVYYNCPGLCTPIMDGMVKLLNRTDLEIGKDFEVINISFHESETPELAVLKKRNYISLTEDENSRDHWHFLCGDSANIGTLLDALGYSVHAEWGRYSSPGSHYDHNRRRKNCQIHTRDKIQSH